MASKNQSNISKDWEGPSALGQYYNTFERISKLLAAASQDDVQAGSIVALRSVGGLCIVHDDLLGKGVDALNGNESVRLRDTKVLLGYRKGLTAKELRDSTAATKGFLLAAALKLCEYDESAAGETLYYMASSEGGREKTTTPKQLSKLISGRWSNGKTYSQIKPMKSIFKVRAFQLIIK